MKKTSRRTFFKTASLGAAAFSARLYSGQPSRSDFLLPADKIPFELGLASYTFRAFSLDDTLAMTKRLGLRKISFKSMHLPLESKPEEIQAVRVKVKAAGLELYAGGVIYMKTELEVRQAFAYAKTAGMKMIIGVPNHELLELVQKCVREDNISCAIHNHGPTDKLYPTPESVCDKVKNFDKRMGLCLDIGHTQRSGLDPAQAAERCLDRLLDVHIKDVTASTAEGVSIEIGRGVIDIPKFLRTLVTLRYSGAVSLEHEKDEKDPLPGAAESIGYVRGVLAAL